MALSRAAVAVLVAVAVAVCLPRAAAENQLVAGERLLAGETLVSEDGVFALGFFPPNDSAARRYLGIWYNSLPGPRTVVWVANREKPAAGAPTLVLANDSSSLVLSDADGRVLWTTTGVGSSPLSPAAAAALTNEGNLVVQSPDGTVLWESFDHLTDTFIPGMKARLSHRTGEGDRLVSWRSPGDPAPGRYSFGLDPATPLQLLMWNGTRPCWRSPVWTGYTLRSIYLSSSTEIYPSILNTEEETSITLTVSDGAAPTRYVLTNSGSFDLITWNDTASAWATLDSWPPSIACSQYGYCGTYGYCDATAVPFPTCLCLDGFEPASATEWRAGRFEQGCRRKHALPLCGLGEGFFSEMPNMQAPDKFSLDAGNGKWSVEECAARCTANCSCVAYAYTKLPNSIVGRCIMWVGDLVDSSMAGTNTAGETLYLRAAASTGRKTSKFAAKIAPPVLAVFLLTCISFVLFCKIRDKGRRNNSTQRQNKMVATTLSEFSEHNTIDPDFSTIGFAEIVAATHNFSETSMIGRGGFGKVYKGTLHSGHVVAIKRLSENSNQGGEEFKNEAILIAKLQHRNLVRLLSCCTEGREKLLIYEYLPNKGLDAILFDSTMKLLLDWPMRLGIIKGVARGLLYLHQDSRLTVIHRDLKASNVLLDEEMRPKIADFGLAKIFCDNQVKSNTKRVVGTFGYIAPEYSKRGIFSMKSDVYSFGVLLLEIVSGLRISCPNDIMDFSSLVVYAWNLWRDGKARDLVDPSMAGSYSNDEALLCIHVGLLCVEDDPSRRPLMSSVVSILENGSGSSSSLPVPIQPGYSTMTEDNRGDIVNTRNTMTMTVLEGR